MANKYRYLYFIQVNTGQGHGWEDYGATDTKTGAEDRARWLRKEAKKWRQMPDGRIARGLRPKNKYRVIKRRVPFNELVWWA